MSSETMSSPRSVWQIIRAEAKLLFAAIVVGLMLGLIYIHVVERRYAVSLVLVPTEASGGAQKSLAGGLGSLASLAGVDLPGAGDTLNFDLLPDAMIFRETATALARDPQILRATFPKLWDSITRSWKEPTDTAYAVKKAVDR